MLLVNFFIFFNILSYDSIAINVINLSDNDKYIVIGLDSGLINFGYKDKSFENGFSFGKNNFGLFRNRIVSKIFQSYDTIISKKSSFVCKKYKIGPNSFSPFIIDELCRVKLIYLSKKNKDRKKVNKIRCLLFGLNNNGKDCDYDPKAKK